MSWYPLDAVDASFFETAPVRERFVADFPVPPAELWGSLASDESVAAWGPGVQRVRWTSPRPYGATTTRDVTLALGAVTVREQFFRWDEGSGYSFYATASNRPGLRRFAEDYVVTETPGGSRLTWTVALEPAGALSRATPALGPVVRVVFGRLVKDGKRYFARSR